MKYNIQDCQTSYKTKFSHDSVSLQAVENVLAIISATHVPLIIMS